MKTISLLRLCIGLFVLTITIKEPVWGQKITTAGTYLDYMNNEQKKIGEDLWRYTNAVAHDKNARKVEAKRQDLIKTTLNAKNNIAKMSDFEGDVSLRDSMVSYLQLSYHILNDDYAKIVDLEAIAEQSYDQMEAYMTAQEMANEKMEQSGTMVELQFKAFADKHNIKLMDDQSKLSKKLETASLVFKYYNKVFLVFFKANKQESYFLDALQKNDINGMEQNRNVLEQYALNGIKSLDTIKTYKNDPSIKTVCKQVLDFYKTEATIKASILIDYYIKNDKFEKEKAAFEAITPANRTKADVDNINKGIAEYNKALAQYNSTLQELNNRRNILSNSWNNAVQSFFERHIPQN